MSELDFELIDESADQDETIVETNEEESSTSTKVKNEDEENTSSTKGKKSNWKKMSKAMKAKDKEIADLKAKLVNNDSDWEDEEDEFEDDSTGFDKTEFRFFTIENPEAKEYKNQMEATLDEYPNMSFEDALTLVKAKIPTESSSSNDFSSKSSNVKVRKKLADLTDEEALKLPNDKYLEYQRLKGKIR